MKKGYTLVELLAVIVILTIIMSLIAVSAVQIYNERKTKEYGEIKKMIEATAQIYAESSSKRISTIVDRNASSVNGCELSYDVLVDNNLLDDDIKNSNTGELLYHNNKYIKITVLSNYEYSYSFQENSLGINNCLNGL